MLVPGDANVTGDRCLHLLDQHDAQIAVATACALRASRLVVPV
jgi:hypothetical protein